MGWLQSLQVRVVLWSRWYVQTSAQQCTYRSVALVTPIVFIINNINTRISNYAEGMAHVWPHEDRASSAAREGSSAAS